MGLNWRQFELGILRSTLESEPEVAIKLVGETIWHESDRLQALGQYPRNPDGVFGPGLGIASIEEPTWDWMHDLAGKQPWHGKIYQCLYYSEYPELAWDLRLNVLACRFRYKLDPRPLPEMFTPDGFGRPTRYVRADDLYLRADYWLKVYNGSGVEARRDKYIADAKVIPWVGGA